MQKKCKKCKYKLQFDCYCNNQKLAEQIEKDKIEIIKEVDNCKKKYSKEISEEEIEYWKELKKQIEPQNNTYRKLSEIIHVIICIFSSIIIISAFIYAFANKEPSTLVVTIPFALFIWAMILAIREMKHRTEQDAYNWIMALVAFASLFFAIYSTFN